MVLACSSGGDRGDEVVVDYSGWLDDGDAVSWPLDPGTYYLEMAASGDGASIEWVGASCPETGQTNSFATTCTLTRRGKVVLRNPTVFGLGAATSVTIRITRVD